MGDLSWYRAKVYRLYCLTNSFFFHDKSISLPCDNVSGILPLPSKLPIFISSWQGRILSSNFWFFDEPVGFLPRAFGEFSLLFWFWNSTRTVSWLPPIPDEIVVHCGRNYSLLHEWVFSYRWTTKRILWCFDYLFYKTKINPLKLIVADVRTNFVQNFHRQIRSRVIMKKFSQAYMKRIVFLSIMYKTMNDLKYSVTFTLNVHRFGSMS